jgi:hypothetical protein
MDLVRATLYSRLGQLGVLSVLNLFTNSPFPAILGLKGRSRKLLSVSIGQTWPETFRLGWHSVTLQHLHKSLYLQRSCQRVLSPAEIENS